MSNKKVSKKKFKKLKYKVANIKYKSNENSEYIEIIHRKKDRIRRITGKLVNFIVTILFVALVLIYAYEVFIK